MQALSSPLPCKLSAVLCHASCSPLLALTLPHAAPALTSQVMKVSSDAVQLTQRVNQSEAEKAAIAAEASQYRLDNVQLSRTVNQAKQQTKKLFRQVQHFEGDNEALAKQVRLLGGAWPGGKRGACHMESGLVSGCACTNWELRFLPL